MAKTQQLKPAKKVMSDGATRAKYPRQSVESALRIPKAILEQNAGRVVRGRQAVQLNPHPPHSNCTTTRKKVVSQFEF
jgi:hypothetical protein